jgi:hypothetical protein
MSKRVNTELIGASPGRTRTVEAGSHHFPLQSIIATICYMPTTGSPNGHLNEKWEALHETFGFVPKSTKLVSFDAFTSHKDCEQPFPSLICGCEAQNIRQVI